MITYPRYLESRSQNTFRLIGLGNAGIGIMDRMAASGATSIDMVAINSDQQSLSHSSVAKKVSIGPMTTHGLGTGGDPEMGLEAAKESRSEIRRALEGADIIFLCTGLGGGTGSGAAPMIAEMAKENGALLVAIVTSPFSFEGRRRSQQAATALKDISRYTDAIIHFENDRLSELSAPHAVASETFAICDSILFQSVLAITRMLNCSGPIPVSLPDLLNVLRAGQGSCLFGYGEAQGDKRSHNALEKLLHSPLLDSGRLLHEAGSVLIHISGPSTLGIAEVGAIMQEISKNVAPSANLHLGVSSSEDHSSPLAVTLIGKCGQPTRVTVPLPAQAPAPRPVPQPVPQPEPPRQPTVTQSSFIEPPAATTPPPPTEKHHTPKVQQPLLPLDPIDRGRFEKIEPTIVEGEDLDIPTFLRRKNKK